MLDKRLRVCDKARFAVAPDRREKMAAIYRRRDKAMGADTGTAQDKDRWRRVSCLPVGQRTLIMGIVNVTPDSFSGDGLRVDEGDVSNGQVSNDVVDRALKQAESFLADGADILDVGGESTRPGSEQVAEAEETARVLPVIAALRSTYPDAVISIDTYKASVACAALSEGADIINDVWGGRADPEMLPLAAELGCPIILMHNRSKPGHADLDRRLGGSYRATAYGDFLAEILDELRSLVDAARAAGVAKDAIWLDPGVGFGKTIQQNMALVDRLDAIKALGYPVLLGTSRKSFIGKVLDVPADERVEGTAATCALGVIRGADAVRVHDVRHVGRTVRMTEAMLTAGKALSAESSVPNQQEKHNG